MFYVVSSLYSLSYVCLQLKTAIMYNVRDKQTVTHVQPLSCSLSFVTEVHEIHRL